MARPRVPLEQRFWTKVQRQDGEKCWLWTGAISGSGYGTVALPVTGKSINAHRIAYELVYGPIPDNLNVLHRCDVRNCVRPDHLFLGTYHDNTMDAIHKGRFPQAEGTPGEKNHNAKLTEVQVIQIKHQLLANVPVESIAAQFGVHKQTIIEIRKERNWKQVRI